MYYELHTSNKLSILIQLPVSRCVGKCLPQCLLVYRYWKQAVIPQITTINHVLTGNKGLPVLRSQPLATILFNQGMKEQTRKGTCIPTADRIHPNIVVLHLQTVHFKQDVAIP